MTDERTHGGRRIAERLWANVHDIHIQECGHGRSDKYQKPFGGMKPHHADRHKGYCQEERSNYDVEHEAYRVASRSSKKDDACSLGHQTSDFGAREDEDIPGRDVAHDQAKV